jgi:hypothetical protein
VGGVVYRERFKRGNGYQRIKDKQSGKRAVTYDSDVSEGAQVK